MGQITVSGMLVGVLTTWFAFGFIAYLHERDILDSDYFNFTTLLFTIVVFPFVFLWTFTTNKQYRKDFVKNIKNKFKKKA